MVLTAAGEGGQTRMRRVRVQCAERRTVLLALTALDALWEWDGTVLAALPSITGHGSAAARELMSEVFGKRWADAHATTAIERSVYAGSKRATWLWRGAPVVWDVQVVMIFIADHAAMTRTVGSNTAWLPQVPPFAITTPSAVALGLAAAYTAALGGGVVMDLHTAQPLRRGQHEDLLEALDAAPDVLTAATTTQEPTLSVSVATEVERQGKFGLGMRFATAGAATGTLVVQNIHTEQRASRVTVCFLFAELRKVLEGGELTGLGVERVLGECADVDRGSGELRVTAVAWIMTDPAAAARCLEAAVEGSDLSGGLPYVDGWVDVPAHEQCLLLRHSIQWERGEHPTVRSSAEVRLGGSVEIMSVRRRARSCRPIDSYAAPRSGSRDARRPRPVAGGDDVHTDDGRPRRSTAGQRRSQPTDTRQYGRSSEYQVDDAAARGAAAAAAATAVEAASAASAAGGRVDGCNDGDVQRLEVVTPAAGSLMAELDGWMAVYGSCGAVLTLTNGVTVTGTPGNYTAQAPSVGSEGAAPTTSMDTAGADPDGGYAQVQERHERAAVLDAALFGRVQPPPIGGEDATSTTSVDTTGADPDSGYATPTTPSGHCGGHADDGQTMTAPNACATTEAPPATRAAATRNGPRQWMIRLFALRAMFERVQIRAIAARAKRERERLEAEAREHALHAREQIARRQRDDRRARAQLVRRTLLGRAVLRWMTETLVRSLSPAEQPAQRESQWCFRRALTELARGLRRLIVVGNRVTSSEWHARARAHARAGIDALAWVQAYGELACSLAPTRRLDMRQYTAEWKAAVAVVRKVTACDGGALTFKRLSWQSARAARRTLEARLREAVSEKLECADEARGLATAFTHKVTSGGPAKAEERREAARIAARATARAVMAAVQAARLGLTRAVDAVMATLVPLVSPDQPAPSTPVSMSAPTPTPVADAGSAIAARIAPQTARNVQRAVADAELRAGRRWLSIRLTLGRPCEHGCGNPALIEAMVYRAVFVDDELHGRLGSEYEREGGGAPVGTCPECGAQCETADGECEECGGVLAASHDGMYVPMGEGHGVTGDWTRQRQQRGEWGSRPIAYLCGGCAQASLAECEKLSGQGGLNTHDARSMPMLLWVYMCLGDRACAFCDALLQRRAASRSRLISGAA